MKKQIALFLAILLMLSLEACGKAEEHPAADLNAVYTACADHLPEMLVLDETMMMNFLGIAAEDCVQVIAAICANGLQADEVWLVQAKDEAALSRLVALAKTRQQAKAEETEFYLPDQYTIVKDGQILTDGLYMAYLVSPNVQEIQAEFEKAMK